MSALMTLANLLGLVAFGTYIWLLVLAFKRSAGWGLAVLFLSPIAAIIFAIQYWEESKKPFLITTGCSIGAIAIALLVFGKMGGFDMYRMVRDAENGQITEEQAAEFFEKTLDTWENSGLLDEDEMAELRQIRKAFNEGLRSEAEFNEAMNRITKNKTLPASGTAGGSRVASNSGGKRLPLPPRYEPVPLRDAGRHVGKEIRVIERGGLRYKGTLAKADSSSLLIKRYLAAGTVTFEISKAQIQTLEVYYN